MGTCIGLRDPRSAPERTTMNPYVSADETRNTLRMKSAIATAPDQLQ